MRMLIGFVSLWCLYTVTCASKDIVLKRLFELKDTCRRMYVDLDDYSLVDMSSRAPNAHYAVKAHSSCLVFFKTAQPRHGICIRMHSVVLLSENVKLQFITGPYGPERIFAKGVSQTRGYWCFPNRLVAVKVKTTAAEKRVDHAIIYSFTVTNVSIDDIPRQYYMDSFAECGLTHTLSAGKSVSLEAERIPRVTSDLPDTCRLTFVTKGKDEFEQVCVELKVTTSIQRERKEEGGEEAGEEQEEETFGLQMKGLNSRFYSTGNALKGLIVCSQNKRLEIFLNRTTPASLNFQATVTSQWHPNWETEKTEASELYSLRVVKGITYFIATVDVVMAVLATLVAAMLKRPGGPWSRWAHYFTRHAPAPEQQTFPAVPDPANYGSMHANKDGNYPELPLEGATPTKEVLVEAHTY